MANILVTCVGSGVGQSVVDSLLINRKNRIVGCDANRNVYANSLCDVFYEVINIYDEKYLDMILDISIKENVDMIVPGHDHELLLFSHEIESFNSKGIEVMVSKPDLIAVSRDKYEWYTYFKGYDCPVVPTYLVKEFKKNPDPNIFPAIIKPTGGSASQGITILNTIDELGNVTDNDIIQPYLFPCKDDPNYKPILENVKNGRFVQRSEISIQLIFNKDSKYVGIFISKNILKSGVPITINPIQPDQFEYIDDIMKFVPVLESKNVRGPVNIQGRITEKGLICFEMNMRFTGITGNRAQFGFNEASFLIDNFLNKKAELGHYAPNKIGVRQVACTTIERKEVDRKNIGVTGASGFIGSCFVQELTQRADTNEVFLFISKNENIEAYQKLYGKQQGISIVEVEEDSARDKYALCDVFVNFAGALANASDEDIFNAIQFQYKQAQFVQKANIPLVINISSQSVYDQTKDIAKTEEEELTIKNFYAFQKQIGEEFYKTIQNNSPSSKVISLRFTRVIGVPADNRKPFGFFAHVINALKNDEEINLTLPNNKLNLLDVRDAAHAIFHMMDYEHKDRLPEVINIGGTNLSSEEYCNKVIEVLSLQSKAHLIKKGDDMATKVSSLVDCSLAKRFSWENKYSIEDTILSISNNL